jgi:hypothetical protein
MTTPAQPRAVEVALRRDGVTGYLVALPPEALPPVRMRDLAAAWDAARSAADGARWDVPRLFRFRRAGSDVGGEAFVELVLADADACCWAGAVDRTLGLASAYGISVCLRLLALVDLMASAPWASAWFALRREGAEIDHKLLLAAAATPLTAQGGLDEAGLRTRLCDAADGRTLIPSGACV